MGEYIQENGSFKNNNDNTSEKMVSNTLNLLYQTTSFSLKTWLNIVNQTYENSSSHGVLFHPFVIPLNYMQVLTVSL